MIQMNEFYELINTCFSSFGMSINHEVTDKLYNHVQKNGVIFSEYSEDGTLCGISSVVKNSILMMCVNPEHQRNGVGSRLLKQSEDYIKSNGYEKIRLGNGDGYVIQGVPFKDSYADGAVTFFTNHGYSATWDSIDMSMKLSDFQVTEICPENIIFRYAEPDDTAELLSAVESVNEAWCGYYEDTSIPVLLAVDSLSGKIVGFQFVEADIGNIFFSDRTTGGVGCVGVIPVYRKKGIGRAMVSEGTAELKKLGCTASLIGYTYLENWYGKLGYKTHMHFWMGEKTL